MSNQSIFEKSLAQIFSEQPQEEIDAFYASLTSAQAEGLQYDWSFWSRPKQQIPKGDWFTWLLNAGRGFGKTRTGAETVREWQSQGVGLFALVGQTTADIRDIMLEGESGLLTISPKWNKPIYIASKRLVEWNNGARAYLYSGDEPDQLRGPQHEKAWVDELVKFKYAIACWDNLEFGLRLGKRPQIVLTTTPKPFPLLKTIMKDPKTVISSGSTYENKTNLAPSFIERVISKYEGTRIGRQELYAEVLSDTKGAMWTYEIISRNRIRVCPPLIRIVVAIDPATTSTDFSDDTGISAAGLGFDGHIYVLRDDTMHGTPNSWALRSIKTFTELEADKIIGEANNGGDLIETILRNISPNIPYKKVNAARGKQTRAEPVVALYEQNKVHHVGEFIELETEMCEWVPADVKKSPNRIDALVWAIHELALAEDEIGDIRSMKRFL